MKWLSRFRFKSRKPSHASITACPQCHQEMVFVEKFTMMGDDRRTYRCERCGIERVIDFGPALWKIMSDANKSGDTH